MTKFETEIKVAFWNRKEKVLPSSPTMNYQAPNWSKIFQTIEEPIEGVYLFKTLFLIGLIL
jgi:hypothetical protein